MLETGVGRAANLAVAALPSMALPPDLDPRGRYAPDLADPRLPTDAGVAVPHGPGTGAVPRPRRTRDTGRARVVTMTADVTLDDVLAAAARIEGAVERTPSARSHTLSQVLGAGIVVKFENLQFTAAFKERGALNKLLSLTDDERRCGVVAMSAGNHAQAVARHATRLGIEATIVMPAHTPFVKVQRTEVLGARVVLHGADLGEATHEAQRLAAEGRTFVHPYDDPAVIAGQGTVALELLADHPELDALVVPTGGGGLLAGWRSWPAPSDRR